MQWYIQHKTSHEKKSHDHHAPLLFNIFEKKMGFREEKKG